MLPLTIEKTERYDEDQRKFFTYKGDKTLKLEHSLLAISNWEAKYEKRFIGNEDISNEEMLDYIRMMVTNENVDPDFVYYLSKADVESIKDYMNKTHTATIVNSSGGSTSYQFITSELIYSWMAGLQIPFSCETWNINRLLKLIEVSNENNKPKKKMSHSEAMARQRAANAKARAKHHSKG